MRNLSASDNILAKLHSLVIFRNILSDRAIKMLTAILTPDEIKLNKKIDIYCEFTRSLFEKTTSLTDYILGLVLSDENFYVKIIGKGETPPPIFENCLKNELSVLENLSHLEARDLKKLIGYDGYLPEWETSQIDLFKAFNSRMESICVSGYGIYSQNLMFSLLNNEIVPVKTPDSVRLSDLKGYERERSIVIENTLALLDSKPAANTLLYGDAGTGKSSTVKAVVNEYGSRGLRLVEVRKNQLLEIPSVIEKLSENPLKFIVFIDDLSFIHSNEETGALKAILEGSAFAKTPNIAIYATSNRRHIVNETFSDRGSDDIHRNETIEEQTSLSDRFGLSVNFIKPNKKNYLEIVHKLILQHEIDTDDYDVDLLAERFALDKGGRSPRTAKHFVEYLKRK